MRERYERELEEILQNRQKPTFWIDRESANALKPKATESYHKFKAKNIRLHQTKDDGPAGMLVNVDSLSLGYDGKPLFTELSFQLRGGERLHVVGRNGAGKTTLVSAIMQAADAQIPDTLIGRGVIDCARHVNISHYEQEIGPELLPMTLADAIEQIYRSKNLPVTSEQIMRDMGNYLFDPQVDKDVEVKRLSGGQKARLQLIRLLVGEPNLLILDEPTNHLDLPSIEELENALKDYRGAVIYISHDSYFAKNVGGETLTI